MNCFQVMIFLAAGAVTAEPPKSETIDYVFAGEALTILGKDTNEGRKFHDPNLKKRVEATGASALLVRVRKADGKIKEIEVFYSVAPEPKVFPLRDGSFTPDEKTNIKGVEHVGNDFKLLLKAVGLSSN